MLNARPTAGASPLTARLVVDTDFTAAIRLTLPTSVRRCSSSSHLPYAKSMPPTNATDWSTMTSFSWWAQRYTEEDTWSGCLITWGENQHSSSASLPGLHPSRQRAAQRGFFGCSGWWGNTGVFRRCLRTDCCSYRSYMTTPELAWALRAGRCFPTMGVFPSRNSYWCWDRSRWKQQSSKEDHSQGKLFQQIKSLFQ